MRLRPYVNDLAFEYVRKWVADNKPAIKCYERAGFAATEMLKGDFDYNGQRRKCYRMEINL